MKIGVIKKNIILTLGMILSPLLAFVISTYFFYQRHSASTFFISLFFSLLAYSMIPYATMDLAGHYHSFDIIANEGFESYQSNERYALLYFIMETLSFLGLGRQTLPLIFIFLTYFLTLACLQKCLRLKVQDFNGSIKILSVLFLFLLLSQMRLIPYASGLRSALANAIVLFAIIQVLLFNKSLYYVLLFISPLIHISTVIYFPLVILCKVFNQKILGRISKIILVATAIMLVTRSGADIIKFTLNYISPLLPADIKFLVDIYTTGYWGADFKNNVDYVTFFYELVLKPSPIYVFYLYIIFSFNSSRVTPLKFFSIILLFFVSIFIEFRTIVDRYGDLLLQVMILNLLLDFYKSEYSRHKRLQVITATILCFLYFVIDMAGARVFREVIAYSWGVTPFISIFYYPFIDIKDTDFIIR